MGRYRHLSEEDGNCLIALAIPVQGTGMRQSRELVVSQVKENLGQVSASSVQLREIKEAKEICISPDFRRTNVKESAVMA